MSAATGLLPPRLVQAVLAFWFEGILSNPTAAVPPSLARRWFVADPAVDRQVADLVPPAKISELASKASTALALSSSSSSSSYNLADTDTDTLLAAVIVLDQFSRNVFRGTPRAFASDPIARRLADRLPDCSGSSSRSNSKSKLELNRRGFKILPFMHSEEIGDQKRCLAMCEAWTRDCAAVPQVKAFAEMTLRSAQDHYDLISKYGRFPHRNEILGRESTPEEIAFMANGGNTLGQIKKPSA
ncbi:hypothetical protein HDU87_005196 [Geranomyces variabilis]|uniref:DUF924-domain-containing protein n=1 Tax=Geranomyces variabilis TaxID=109894 RepID=A0AAD5THC1_9FUNG|nr:hypothetical protein HDU87_005196 [Geranomyces variabilis]